MTPYLETHGIAQRVSCSKTPEQNGCAERKRRHIVETALAMMHTVQIPMKFWCHAFDCANHIINRRPTPLLDFNSPFHCLFGTAPDYSGLRVFGCLCYPCYVYTLRTNLKKDPNHVFSWDIVKLIKDIVA